jgi:sugar phosphate isomerase/epimerase
MRLGIFAKTFPRSSLEETLDAVRAYGRAACSSIVSERLSEKG